jgi:hypothetical protein
MAQCDRIATQRERVDAALFGIEKDPGPSATFEMTPKK